MTCWGFLIFMTCAPPEPVAPPAAPYCDVAKPVQWSAHDTRATKEAVDTENRKWRKLCEVAK